MIRSRPGCHRLRLRAATALGLVLLGPAAQAAVDLAVTIAASRLTVEPGVSGADLIDFTVRVTNGGNELTGAIVTNTLSAGLVIPTGLSAVVTQGDFDAATGRWDVGLLGAGQVATLQLPARAVAGASGCLSDSAAAVTAPGWPIDDAPANNAAKLSIGAPSCVDLVVTSVQQDLVNGDCLDATQRFTVTNRGPNVATAVVLDVDRYEVTRPASFAEENCTGSGAVVVPGGGPVSLGTLASGQSREFATGLLDLQRGGPDITVSFAVDAAAVQPDADASNSSESGSFVIRRGSGSFTGDGDGTVCVISNVLRATSLADELPLLRRFRDRYLMSNAAGRAVIAWYRRVSPPAAAVVSRHEILGDALRVALWPVIMGLKFPGAATVLLLAPLLVLLMRLDVRRGRVAG